MYPRLEYHYNKVVFILLGGAFVSATIALLYFLPPFHGVEFWIKLVVALILLPVTIYVIRKGCIPAMKEEPILVIDEHGITDNSYFALGLVSWAYIGKISLTVDNSGEVTTYMLVLLLNDAGAVHFGKTAIEINTGYLKGNSDDIAAAARDYFCHFR